MYQDEENLYWLEVETLQEKLAKLVKPQVAAINQTAETLLNLRESWENATQAELRELVHLMLQEVGCSIREQQVIWVKPKQEFEILFTWLIIYNQQNMGIFGSWLTKNIRDFRAYKAKFFYDRPTTGNPLITGAYNAIQRT